MALSRPVLGLILSAGAGAYAYKKHQDYVACKNDPTKFLCFEDTAASIATITLAGLLAATLASVANETEEDY